MGTKTQSGLLVPRDATRARERRGTSAPQWGRSNALGGARPGQSAPAGEGEQGLKTLVSHHERYKSRIERELKAEKNDAKYKTASAEKCGRGAEEW